MGAHDGHRERHRSRFIEHGLDNFKDHEVLELLLFFALARGDTNELAHRLIAHFGGLDGVFEATIEDLCKVKGIGQKTAALIHLVPQVARRYQMVKARADTVLNSAERAGKFFIPLFQYERDEVVYVASLDAKCKLICCREISRGVANTTEVSLRKIVELALSQNASIVIISHNHTSGIAIPSAEDECTTKKIKQALGIVGITLADHIIVAGEDFVSLVDSGML